MLLSHTLLRIIPNTEGKILTQEQEELVYEKPEIDIILAGKSLEECQQALQLIESKMAFLSNILQQKININTSKNITRTESKAMYDNLKQDILKSVDYQKFNFCFRLNDFWLDVDMAVKSVVGEYMIVPAYYKNVNLNVIY
ncbi:MAG: hypothetical protein EKK64_04005 [Neisseriaceae bacterium]|nr:MAG: hypothetical protein EKK64_04005 [Neisseriaceae bacterium]